MKTIKEETYYTLYVSLVDKNTKHQKLMTTTAYKVIRNALDKGGLPADSITEWHWLDKNLNESLMLKCALGIDEPKADVVESIRQALNPDRIIMEQKKVKVMEI